MLKLTAFWAFLKANRRLVMIAGLAGLAIFGAIRFNSWKADVRSEARAAGFAEAQGQYKARIDAANMIAAKDQKSIDTFTAALGTLATNRSSDLTVRVQPAIESIKHEVATDPRYRDCTVSVGVLDAINAARATVNASVDASAPGKP